MTPLIQVLSIGTMATWLTMSGASTVACIVRVEYLLPERKLGGEFDLSMSDVFDLDQQDAGMAAGSAAPDAPSDSPETIEPLTPIEPVAALPELAEIEPLPDVPDLPEPKPDDLQTEKPRERPKAREASPQPRRARTTAATTTGRPGGNNGTTGVGTGTGNGTAKGPGSNAVGADRLTKGRMPKPTYPSSCREKGQQGRVGITFTVDESGNVVAARVSSPCLFPDLNQAALNGVYRWKFPSGAGRVTAIKAIDFKLTGS